MVAAKLATLKESRAALITKQMLSEAAKRLSIDLNYLTPDGAAYHLKRWDEAFKDADYYTKLVSLIREWKSEAA
jgi:hypothetical protein